MYEWTVQEATVVRCLKDDASVGLIVAQYSAKAVIVTMPAWDSIGTVYFNEEKWHAGYGQSQLRQMLEVARSIGGDVRMEDPILSTIEFLKFEKAPEGR